MFNFKEEHNLNKSNIFKEIDSYTIFRYYIGEFILGRAISSPLRKDENPSFTINHNKVTNEFFYDDKVLGGGDSIAFVQKLFSLEYRATLVKIVKDLGIADKFDLREQEKQGKISNKKIEFKVDLDKIIQKSEVEINVKTRNWSNNDKKFWTQFGITKKTLEEYNVLPITHIFYKNSIVKTDEYAYVFREFKDFKETLTIYQPFNKKHKWIKTHDSSTWYGWNQLPERGSKVIITKSLKDIMAIRDVMKIHSTGLQNEKIMPKLGVILDLMGRFEDTYYLGDNDFDKEKNWGRIAAKKWEKEYHVNLLEIPDEYKCKDFSDLVKKYGPKKSKQILEKLINNVIYF